MITLKKLHYKKTPGTKNAWKLVETETEKEITEQEYNNITSPETQRFFRRLGGRSETARRHYTRHGYRVFRLISTSPDRQEKKFYNFEFK